MKFLITFVFAIFAFAVTYGQYDDPGPADFDPNKTDAIIRTRRNAETGKRPLGKQNFNSQKGCNGAMNEDDDTVVDLKMGSLNDDSVHTHNGTKVAGCTRCGKKKGKGGKGGKGKGKGKGGKGKKGKGKKGCGK